MMKIKIFGIVLFLSLCLLFLFLISLSCKQIESEVMTEKAEVVNLVYLPDTHSSNIAPGFNSNGGVTFTVIKTGHGEYFGVVLRCEKHNINFTLSGKDLYEKVKIGKLVDLKYIEIYKIKKDKKIFVKYKTINVSIPEN